MQFLNTKKLKIIEYNVSSLVSHSKRISLNNFLSKNKPDVLLVSETKLSSRHKLSFENYQLFRIDKSEKGTVGTAILLKNKILAEQVVIKNLKSLELTAIKIKLRSSETFLFVSLYNKCNADPLLVKQDLSILNSVSSQYTYAVIGGDFNARHQNWNDNVNSTQGIAINDWLESNVANHNFVTISQNKPTFPRSGSILDFYLVTNNLVNILPQMLNFKCKILASDSDHKAVKLKIALGNSLDFMLTQQEFKINLSKIDWEEFQNCVSRSLDNTSTPQDRNLTNNEIDDSIKILERVINSSLEIQRPQTVPSNYKYKDLPIFIQNLYKFRQKLKKILHRVYNQTFSTRTPRYQSISSQINCINVLIHQNVSNYMAEKMEKRLQRIKPGPNMFKEINSIIGKRQPIPTLRDNQEILVTPEEKANGLADLFETNFRPKPPTHIPDFLSEVNSSVENLINSEIQPITIFASSNTSVHPDNTEIFSSLDDVISIIRKKTNNKKSSGIDGISNFVIRKLPSAAVSILTTIINNSVNNSYFPDIWKKSKITPVPKKGNKYEIQNYRPISLLPCLSKIFEKVILKKFNTICELKGIHQENQFGFKEKHSTLHPIISFANDVTKALNKKEVISACFLDIEKAFDSVWINGLIYKLIEYDFPPHITKIVTSFLTNRQFFVEIDGKRSETKNVRAGVPQGSVLGPSFFNFYTWDQPKNENGTKTLVFADDSLTYSASLSEKISTKRVEDHVSNLADYYKKWGITINTGKSELLLIRKPSSRQYRKGMAKKCRNQKIEILNEKISAKKSVKYLGITFSELHKFSYHAKNVLTKTNLAFVLLNPLLRTKNGLPQKTKTLLYKQVIRPIITYGFPVWFTVNKTTMNKISALERKILRSCTGLYRRPDSNKYYSNDTLYKSANIIPIQNYLIDQAKSALNAVKSHAIETIRNLSNATNVETLSYLNPNAIIDEKFQNLFSGERLAFYADKTPNYHRG